MFGCVMHPGRAALLARHSGAMIILIGFFMVCSKARPIFWMRGLILAVAGFGGVVIWPSLSSAQYPGSAGDLNVGTFSGSSSASSGSSSGSATSSASGSASSSASATDAGSSSGFASDTGLGSGPSAGGESSDGRDRHAAPAATRLQGQDATRKRALIRQFRLEFAKTLTIETAYQRPLKALSADRYLDQFSQELDAGLDRQADLKSLGRDLALVRDAIDDRLDVVIASYNGGSIKRRGLFATSAPVDRSVPALRAEIGRLALKHELLAFGEYSLQAMGYYAK